LRKINVMENFNISNCSIELCKDTKYADILNLRYPNGKIQCWKLQCDGKFQKILFDHRDYFLKIFGNETVKTTLNNQNIFYNLQDLPDINVRRSDEFQLIAGLAAKLYKGGSYFTTMISFDMYKGPIISLKEAFIHTLEFLETIFPNQKLEDCRILEISGVSWNSWFDLEGGEYLSETYIMIHPIQKTIILILIKDTD